MIMHCGRTRSALFALLLGTLTAMPAAAQFPPDSFTNLKVLPRNIRADTLVRMMMGFTRALGVRCTYCHVGEESRPLETYDFASDDKAPKRKARTMIEMLGRINDEHLPRLEQRVQPDLRVECITCHRGVREPRQLQRILLDAYAAAGIDSVLAAYRGLRTRYYGRSTYDFGEVPLADVATELAARNQLGDADRLNALNAEMNPTSTFAKTGHAVSSLMLAFRQGASAGRARYAELKTAYGAVVNEMLVNQTGYNLLRRNEREAALEVFKLNVDEHPNSANVYDSLGEAWAAMGNVQEAIRNYERSLQLDPNNTNASNRLRELRRRDPAHSAFR